MKIDEDTEFRVNWQFMAKAFSPIEDAAYSPNIGSEEMKRLTKEIRSKMDELYGEWTETRVKRGNP